MGNFKLLNDNEVQVVINKLENEYNDAKYYLNFSTPLELFVAAILSAQTKDSVVNSITPQLFSKYKTVKDYANADPNALIKYVNKVTFAENKVKHIIEASKIILEKYAGKIPIKLTYRIGLRDKKRPDDIEKDLMNKIDKKYWKNIAYVLKNHGHKVCHSSKPLCEICLIKDMCPKNGV